MKNKIICWTELKKIAPCIKIIQYIEDKMFIWYRKTISKTKRVNIEIAMENCWLVIKVIENWLARYCGIWKDSSRLWMRNNKGIFQSIIVECFLNNLHHSNIEIESLERPSIQRCSFNYNTFQIIFTMPLFFRISS